MTGLDPITLQEAIPIMAQSIGLKPDEDRPEIISHLNRYRELLYTLYEQFKLFDNVFHCLKVNTFPQVCASCCDPNYTGVTLPNDIVSVENVWIYNRPLTIHSRWREGHTGIGASRCAHTETTEMAETFPTERDPQKCTRLKIYTEREEDDGKCVFIEVINSKDRHVKLQFNLIQDAWSVSKILVKKIVSVSLPSDRKGYVTLAQEDGYELSIYTPAETIPNYRRLKVNHCGSVLVQGVKKFQKIYFDHDIVEVGNSLIIEAAGKYFKFGDNTTEAKELSTAQLHLDKMGVLLNGLIARHRGHATQDGNVFRIRVRNKALPGYRK